MIRLDRVAVRYGQGRRAIAAASDISFAVGPGEAFGLVGESGSGKSTVLRAIAGLIPHAEGQVMLAGEAQPDGGYLLTVRDNGIGMTESEVANALIPFGQNHAKMAVRHEGTGLGLPLAKAMMELHGGSLVVESRRDHGTCVSLFFPASCIASAQQAAA